MIKKLKEYQLEIYNRHIKGETSYDDYIKQREELLEYIKLDKNIDLLKYKR
jgi:hypothetical protein